MNNRASMEQDEDTTEVCAGCYQRFIEPGLQTDQGRFHPSCLSCHECSEPLHGDFWVVDGQRYCQEHRLAAHPRCESCGEVANPENGILRVEGKILHLACLICRLCAMPIQGKMFSEEGGTFLCEMDYRAQQRESLPKCDLCELPLEGQILSALGQRLHPSCFVCCVCGKGLGQSFLETEGKPFCIDCYSNEKAEVCRRCHLPIVPLEDGEQQIVRNETGSAYHSDCYNCIRCHISLLGKPAYSMEDEVVCATCRDDLVDERVRRQTAIEKAKAIEI